MKRVFCAWVICKLAATVFLASIGAVTCLGSLLCPSQAPDEGHK